MVKTTHLTLLLQAMTFRAKDRGSKFPEDCLLHYSRSKNLSLKKVLPFMIIIIVIITAIAITTTTTTMTSHFLVFGASANSYFLSCMNWLSLTKGQFTIRAKYSHLQFSFLARHPGSWISAHLQSSFLLKGNLQRVIFKEHFQKQCITRINLFGFTG